MKNCSVFDMGEFLYLVLLVLVKTSFKFSGRRGALIQG
jgi:hypothetical protein